MADGDASYPYPLDESETPFKKKNNLLKKTIRTKEKTTHQTEI